MAQQAIEKLEEQLNCPICLDTYKKPKLLQCHHVYCQQCLIKLVERGEAGQHSLTCPNCRKVTPVPANGVIGLQSAFQISKFQDSVEKLRDTLFSTGKEAGCCSEHDKKELVLYCKRCKELTCSFCFLQEGKHYNHGYRFLSDMAHECLKELEDDLIPPCEQTLERLSSELQSVLTQIEKMKAATSQRKKKRCEFLDEKSKLTSSEMVKVSSWERKLAEEKEKFRTFFEKPVTFYKTVRTVMQAHQDLKSMVKSACEELEQVQVPILLDPKKCYLKESKLLVGRVGDAGTVIMHVVEPATEDITSSMKCWLDSETDDQRVKCSINRIDRCQYEIAYEPAVKGKHRLNVTVDFGHINGSPFDVIVVDEMADTLGVPLMTLCDLRQPSGVAVNHEGKVFVSEGAGQQVSVFSPRGQKVKTFGKFHKEGPCFHNAITVGSHGAVIYINAKDKTVIRTTAEGKVKRTLSDPSSVGVGVGGTLCDVAYNSYDGKLYMLCSHGCIHRVNSDFTICNDYYIPQTLRFLHPLIKCSDIACASSGKVYVTFPLQQCVGVITSELKFVETFGQHHLLFPTAIAVDNYGVVYVSNHNSDTFISLFTSSGQFLASFGREGTGPGQFNHPLGLAVDASQTLYVCDPDRSCVQVFSCKDVHRRNRRDSRLEPSASPPPPPPPAAVVSHSDTSQVWQSSALYILGAIVIVVAIVLFSFVNKV